MRPTLRFLLAWAFAIGASLGIVTGTHAQTPEYPAKPIKMIVPYAPGGPVDYLGRAIGQELAKQLGQPVVVENRPGAGSTLGIDSVARAPADGYTLAMAGSSNLAVAPNLYAKLPYDPLRDLAPVIGVVKTSFVLAVNPSVRARNLKELIELARSKKGALTYGSSGVGSMSNLAGELLKAREAVELLHVPYKGTSPLVMAALAGEVDVIFPDLATAKPLAQAGKLRLLAVTGARRSGIAPDLPTMAEAGINGYAVDIWYGIVAPAATPKDVVAKLHAATSAVLANAEFRQRLADHGFDVTGEPSDQFAATIRADIEKFGRVIKAAGIKAEP